VLDPADRYHAQILFFGELERETTAFFRRVARRGWTVLDVGANSGYFSLLARDLGGEGSQVSSFEPNPAVVELLLETAHRNGATIRVEPKACGAERGELPLHLGADDRNTGLATLSPGAAKGDVSVSVPVVSLDDYCAENDLAPDLVKIDVEGFEDQVVAGMRTLLGDRVPAHVVCEMSSAPGSPAPASVIAEFERFGYSAHQIRADGTLGPIGEVRFENVCFARRDA
jgi:FkbM family methyltransferase